MAVLATSGCILSLPDFSRKVAQHGTHQPLSIAVQAPQAGPAAYSVTAGAPAEAATPQEALLLSHKPQEPCAACPTSPSLIAEQISNGISNGIHCLPEMMTTGEHRAEEASHLAGSNTARSRPVAMACATSGHQICVPEAEVINTMQAAATKPPCMQRHLPGDWSIQIYCAAPGSYAVMS